MKLNVYASVFLIGMLAHIYLVLDNKITESLFSVGLSLIAGLLMFIELYKLEK